MGKKERKENEHQKAAKNQGTGLDTLVQMGEGGKANIQDIQIPDLWHIAMWLKDADGVRSRDFKHGLIIALDQQLKIFGQQVLDTWHIAHDLRNHIMGVKQDAKN